MLSRKSSDLLQIRKRKKDRNHCKFRSWSSNSPWP